MKPSLVLACALLAVLFAAPAASAQSGGLVAAYGFEEPSGLSAVDSSGAGNTGTLAGPTRSASGRFGAALSFDGVNDRVNVADSASLDLTVGMTLEAWVRPQGGGWRTAILKERPGGLAYALYPSTDSNRPSAEIHAETRGPSAVPSGVWSHLATTYDGATLRLYVNGTQVASRAATGPITVSSGALRIGGNAVWGEYFSGLIDEVRIYNRALTAGELQLDMGRAVASDTQAPTTPVLNGTVSDDDAPSSAR
jgi:Concanavalin A-like lectin/glucanases superfamily